MTNLFFLYNISSQWQTFSKKGFCLCEWPCYMIVLGFVRSMVSDTQLSQPSLLRHLITVCSHTEFTPSEKRSLKINPQTYRKAKGTGVKEQGFDFHARYLLCLQFTRAISTVVIIQAAWVTHIRVQPCVTWSRPATSDPMTRQFLQCQYW